MTKHDPEVFARMADVGLSNRKIARMLGVDESVIRRALTRMDYRRDLIPLDSTDRIELEAPLVHFGDVMITADYHVPLYNPSWVNRMIRTAKDRGIKALIIGGDFWNMDAISRWEPKQPEAELWREQNEGNKVMRVLLETFDPIFYLWGNHDARLHKALGFKLAFSNAMRLMFGKLGDDALERIRFTNLDHMYVIPGEFTPDSERWYVCHPERYSQVPLANPRLISDKVGCNVITCHSHHSAVGYARNGTTVVAEAGGMFDPRKTAYLQRSNSYPRWVNGFSFLQDGRLTVVSDKWEGIAA